MDLKHTINPKLHFQVQPRTWLEELKTALTLVTAKVRNESADLESALSSLMEELKAVRARDGAVWWLGNGGSAALCSHLSQDCLNKLSIRSFTMNEPSLMSCMANDYGYAEVFARPLRTQLRPGDLVILISSSGKSQNILACAAVAEDQGAKLITASSLKEDNALWSLNSEISFFIPTHRYGIAEVGHEALFHSAIESLWFQENSGSRH